MNLQEEIDNKVQASLTADDFDALKEVIPGTSNGIDVFYRDYYGRTLMYMAAARGSNECIKRLVGAGASLNDRVPGFSNVPDMQPRTPLNRAIATGKVATAELLLSLGANPSIPDHDGRSALHHAALKACSAQVARSPKSLQSYIALMNRLAASGCAVDQPDFKGFTPLLSVVHQGQLNQSKILEVLLGLGANVHARADGGIQALHRPWKAENEALLRHLAAAGVDLRAQTLRGSTPLMFAQDLDSIQTLIDLGADPNQADLDGKNLLHHLVTASNHPNSNSSAILRLVEMGVDARQSDLGGHSAVDQLERTDRDRHPEADALRMGILAHEARSTLRSRLPVRSPAQ